VLERFMPYMTRSWRLTWRDGVGWVLGRVEFANP
jgi:hypothetical protein